LLFLFVSFFLARRSWNIPAAPPTHPLTDPWRQPAASSMTTAARTSSC
jgi:hypothetical protein